MSVRDENVFELKLVFFDQLQNGSSLPAGVEHCRFARDFVPDQVAMNLSAGFCSADLTKLAPGAKILGRRQPAAGNRLQFARIESDQRSERAKVDLCGFP